MNDVTQSQAEDFAGLYSVGENNFIEYIRTLGLRTYEGDGTDKKAFAVLKEHSKLRGWGCN